ncbi:50S ribosomal protein L3 N(5)-glutamine methyltransferase [Melaminivora suipulveris]|uniref:50S ribosomal protein L3 N(5)-glutamine methyltransferase n=1 Tax=Melaminivora suipulveris TaxID=2109913 RepID=A0A2R3Q878_9BURK|nr:50S ribosomal protein L3 N(5)-glutamine methyltransferase [Melaminivora suipulveris]AVO47969.1 50S ribosomal protein L3 N(5)-glutamine methyltransferase [Melaminivora suipulveris]
MSAALVVGDSIAALVRSGEQRLLQAGVAFGHGTTNARDEAAWLVLWRLGLPLDSALDESPESVAKRPVAGVDQHAVALLFEERIASRKPAAYLTREAWLQGVSFYVDERAIVPRSLIAELLADGGIDPWLSDRTHRVLDLCTGNGSLAVLAALAWPEVEVTGADLSPGALAVARINVDRHGLGERITLAQGDGLAAAPGPWDLVLCNPPYVNAASMAELPPEYRAEPALALAGGGDGMDFIRELLQALPEQLADDGVLVLEIGHEKPHFEAAFPQLPVFWLDTSAGDEQVLLVTARALGVVQGQSSS